MKKIILQNPKDLTSIIKTFNVSRISISKALNFHTHSNLSNAIRKFALEHGAHLVNDKSNIITIHDESKNMMIQKFGSSAEIKVDKDSNFAVLSVKGKPQVQVQNCTISELMDLQEMAINVAGAE